MTRLSVKEKLSNITNEDKYFLKMEELAENNDLTEVDQLFILDSCCVSGRSVLSHTTITSILDKYSNGEDEVLNQGITMNKSLSDAHIQRLGPKLNQDSFSNLINTQGIEKTLRLLSNIITLRDGVITVKSDGIDYEIESIIALKDSKEFREVTQRIIFKPYPCKDAIAILKDNQELPVMIKSIYGNDLSGVDLIDDIEHSADFNWSLDDKAMTATDIISELEKLKPETPMYVWLDGDRLFIDNIAVQSEKIVITPKDY